MALKKRDVERLVYTAKNRQRQVLWDDDLPGFGIRVYPNGKKAFLLSYRVAGRKRQMTIGPFGQYTVEEARRLAKRHLVAIDEGKDPLEARQKEAQGETVRDLCNAYIERHARPHKRSWRADERRIDRLILPAWGNRKAKSITGSDAAALHNRIGKTAPYEANRTLALISKMFELARRWGFVPKDSANPARDIDRFKEEKRDRWVSPDELPKLAQAIDAEPNVYVRVALWLYLLTGVRKSELLAAKWEDIDWERQELRLGQTKAGRIHYVPLSAPAVAILRDLPRLEGNPYLLPGHVKGRPLVNISKPWTRIRKAAGVEDVRLHDLRRTVGSWLAQSGNSLHLIGRVLNHSNQSTTAIYARFGQDHVKQALEEHGTRLMGVAGKLPAAEIVEISQAEQTGSHQSTNYRR
jgi:integrase